MSLKPEQTRGARYASRRTKQTAKAAAKRKRRRLEKVMLDDTPKSVIHGWAD